MNDKMVRLGKESSVIRELSACAEKRKKEIGQDHVYDFTIGNPNAKTPDLVTHNLVELLLHQSDRLHDYTAASGDLYVREALIQHLNETYGCQENKEYLYLTSGASASLSIAIHALINPHDEVLLFAPFFPEYPVYIEDAGGKVIPIVTDSQNGFIPSLKKIRETMTSKTKMVIINSPNNPTGVVYPESFIRFLSLLLKEKQQEYGHPIYLLSDEPYRELIYTKQKYPFVTNYYENSLVCYSYSKTLSLPGERIGYLLVSNRCIHKEEVFAAISGAGRALGFICAPSLFQHLLPTCLHVTADFSLYDQNRQEMLAILNEFHYQIAAKAEGAFYLFVKALEDDAIQFCETAKQFDLFMVPSDSFGLPGFVRISYCVSPTTIKNSKVAFEQLKKYYEERV